MLFCLRALLPTGFMPDPDALRAGHFHLIYCSAAGSIPAGKAIAGHMHGMAAHAFVAGGAPAAPDGAGMPADCPYGLTGTHTLLPSLPIVVASMLALAWRMPAPPAAPSSAPGIIGGPPVGSRAPPSHLA
ncbi:hypothetical protein [Bordetella sp. H567]|uniref:hypothetical protein n=1 Tax=Bordetella sp. H567 TaxID=1697043 RepID=UPI00082C471E|nr:hypothetical protein [Bordetella sp. H567]